MPAKSPYPAELRRRAVRMVAEMRPDYPTKWADQRGGDQAWHRHRGDCCAPWAECHRGRASARSKGMSCPPAGRNIIYGP